MFPLGCPLWIRSAVISRTPGCGRERLRSQRARVLPPTRIDQIWLSQVIEPRSLRVVRIERSDHRAVLAELWLAEQVMALSKRWQEFASVPAGASLQGLRRRYHSDRNSSSIRSARNIFRSD